MKYYDSSNGIEKCHVNVEKCDVNLNIQCQMINLTYKL